MTAALAKIRSPSQAIGIDGLDRSRDGALDRALASIAPNGILLSHREIMPADEMALFDEEARSLPSPLPSLRRASGAARIAARELLVELGFAAQALPKGASGAPAWPRGLVGSLAHDETIAVAALARRSDIAALGIDIEPALPLPADIHELVATPFEQRHWQDDPLRGRILFAMKEAVYKALNPLDGQFLDYQDIEVDLAAARATTRGGRSLDIAVCPSPRVIALAWIRAG
jgi:4'-phosphopantetheinyl transferase EntD